MFAAQFIQQLVFLHLLYDDFEAAYFLGGNLLPISLRNTRNALFGMVPRSVEDLIKIGAPFRTKIRTLMSLRYC
jgi:hypothetical protein